MTTKYCTNCGNKLPPHNVGQRCPTCQEKAKEKHVSALQDYYTTRDMMEILDLTSEEQVRRLSREGKIPGRVPGIKQHLFVKKIVDKWIEEGQPIPRIPTSPIQEKARAMCRRHDHSWMREEEYEGNSYLRETQVDQGEHTIIIGFIHRCYFCDYTEYHPFGS